jgi:hypothetical protein
MARRSSEARKVLRELDAELESVRRASGKPLQWSAAEAQLRTEIADALDRKADLMAAYADAEDIELKVKLSGEIRLLQNAVARWVQQVKTDLPQPRSRTSEKAAAAARARWDREKGLG